MRCLRPFRPIDPASIAVFRIAFGTLMAWEMWRYFSHDWIRRYYITPAFHFTYYGFGWVAPWPGDGMYVHFVFPLTWAVLHPLPARLRNR